jgi:hypothetical protein
LRKNDRLLINRARKQSASESPLRVIPGLGLRRRLCACSHDVKRVAGLHARSGAYFQAARARHSNRTRCPRSRQLLQQRLRILQIARVKTFGKPPIHRSQQFAPDGRSKNIWLCSTMRPSALRPMSCPSSSHRPIRQRDGPEPMATSILRLFYQLSDRCRQRHYC